jgi:hypothetical protein
VTDPDRPRQLPVTSYPLRLYKGLDFSGYNEAPAETTTDVDQAQVISSEIVGSMGHHLVVLDIDVPAKLLPSSTPNHWHLYIEKPVTWFQYVNLLRALEDAGIVEPGYVSASIERGNTRVRLPWIKKEAVA